MRTHIGPTTSTTLFDASAPPDYEEELPPSFSEVSLALELTSSFIQPMSTGSTVPLYSFSAPLNGVTAHGVKIQRLYHKALDDLDSRARVNRTALPVYEIRKGLWKDSLYPLLESASHWKVVHGERKPGIGGVSLEFNLGAEKKCADTEARTVNE
jgi:hypothetical protein